MVTFYYLCQITFYCKGSEITKSYFDFVNPLFCKYVQSIHQFINQSINQLITFTDRSLEKIELRNAYACLLELIIHYATEGCLDPWNEDQINFIIEILNAYHETNMKSKYSSTSTTKRRNEAIHISFLVLSYIDVVIAKSPVDKVKVCLEKIKEDISRLSMEGNDNPYDDPRLTVSERNTIFLQSHIHESPEKK